MNKISRNKFFAVALDIGTTDIKGSLSDITTGKELAKASVPNEQRVFGQDVITRLHFAVRREKGLKELNKKVIHAVNKLLRKLAKDASISVIDIKKIIAVGNSAMYHLILMIKPDSLARAPFLPAEKMSREKDANKMGITIGKGAAFKFLPNISGFVGSDILAAILFTGIHKDKKYNLIMDVGTNGEIVLGCK
ncbi:MAG: ferredoxin, partial [Candidatus Omnitrophota bacterium]|nr:ferredoxin [Candidatus Omnitrophota bacterium]